VTRQKTHVRRLVVALRIAIFAVPVPLAGCSTGDPASDSPNVALGEASTGFDQGEVMPFLQRVANLVEGFDATQARTLSDEIARMPVESERAWNLRVRHRDAEVSLRIHAFMDDVATPDLTFSTTRELAAEIDREMAAHAEELGI